MVGLGVMEASVSIVEIHLLDQIQARNFLQFKTSNLK